MEVEKKLRDFISGDTEVEKHRTQIYVSNSLSTQLLLEELHRMQSRTMLQVRVSIQQKAILLDEKRRI